MILKSIITALLLAAVSNAAVAQTHKVTWALTDFSAGSTSFSWLELDVVETGRYMSAHGAILTQAKQLSPVSGTCAPISSGYFCNLHIDRSSYYLSLDTKLNGKVTGRDAAGNSLPEATATLYSRQ
jgi:hypothetical protein